MKQFDFTAKYEGIVPHLYLDSRGNPTCGIGFLVENREDLRKFAWNPNLQEAQADWVLLKDLPANRVPGFYRKAVRASLSDAEMRKHFDIEVGKFRALLSSKGWKIATLPIPAQIAVVDMAYCLGVGGLEKFTKLKAAVLSGNWSEASKQCSRKGVQEERNVATSALFAQAGRS